MPSYPHTEGVKKLGPKCRSSAGPSALNLTHILNHALRGAAMYYRAFGPLHFCYRSECSGSVPIAVQA